MAPRRRRFLRTRLVWATLGPRIQTLSACLFIALLLVLALRFQWPSP